MRAYKANMIPGGTTPVINVSQYDNDYAVTVTLIEGAEIYTPPVGATIRVEGMKPDGHGFEYPCTYQGNVVTMPIYTQMTVVAGRFPIELVVYQSGLRVGSCNIIFAVERAPLGEGTDISETVIPDIIAGAQAQADAAAASATQAASSAASAETAKDAAMGAAQDAIDAAQELQTAIQFNAALIHETASGAVASFADGADDIPMQSVIAEITPVQDLNGQANPYPAGGGKNLLPPFESFTESGITATVASDGTITLNGTATVNIGKQVTLNLPAGQYTFSLNNPVAVGTSGSNTIYMYAVDAGGSWVMNPMGYRVNAKGTGVSENEITIARLVITNGVTLNNFVIKPQLETGSTATAFAPYSNICPISGRTGMTVTRCGRNLGKITLSSIADADIGEGSYTLAGLTFSFTKVSDNGVSEIVVNGTPTARATSMLNRDLLVYMPPGRYILSGCPSGGALNKYRLTCWDNTTSATLASDFGSGATFELVEGHNVNFAIDISASMAGETISNLVFKPMIRPASDSDDAYEPYTGTSIPITWESIAGTVYGGTLDVVSGVLTVNGVLHTLDGTEGFALSTNARRFTKAFSALKWERANTVLSTQNQSNSICSHATYLTGATGTATPADYRISTDSSNAQAINFYDTQSEYANAAAFNAYLAAQYANGTPVQLYYELATPLDPIQLSPTEVKTLLGGNSIYTDAGSVSVEYIADTKLYIDGKVAELQALILEN